MTYLKKCLTVAVLALLPVTTPLANASNVELSQSNVPLYSYAEALMARAGQTFPVILSADKTEAVVELRRVPTCQEYLATGAVTNVYRVMNAEKFFANDPNNQEFPDSFYSPTRIAVPHQSMDTLLAAEKLEKVDLSYQEKRVWPYIQGFGWLNPDKFGRYLKAFEEYTTHKKSEYIKAEKAVQKVFTFKPTK